MLKIINIVPSFFQINVSYEDFENLTKDHVKDSSKIMGPLPIVHQWQLNRCNIQQNGNKISCHLTMKPTMD
jgi:hypothetical protein